MSRGYCGVAPDCPLPAGWSWLRDADAALRLPTDVSASLDWVIGGALSSQRGPSESVASPPTLTGEGPAAVRRVDATGQRPWTYRARRPAGPAANVRLASRLRLISAVGHGSGVTEDARLASVAGCGHGIPHPG
jgi:hypothetical protein